MHVSVARPLRVLEPRHEQRVAELSASTIRLESEVEALRNELARARTTLEVDRQAQEQLKTTLAESEARVAALKAQDKLLEAQRLAQRQQGGAPRIMLRRRRSHLVHELPGASHP